MLTFFQARSIRVSSRRKGRPPAKWLRCVVPWLDDRPHHNPGAWRPRPSSPPPPGLRFLAKPAKSRQSRLGVTPCWQRLTCR